jgi:hypothetical protein
MRAVSHGFLESATAQGMRAAQELGYRITSGFRPDDPSAHGRGKAFDAAHFTWSRGDYTPAEAKRLKDALESATPGTKWLVVAEDDHFHAEHDDRLRPGVAEQSDHTKGRYVMYEYGSPNLGKLTPAQMARALDVRGFEKGSPAPQADPRTIVPSVESAGVITLERELRKGTLSAANAVDTAMSVAPKMVETAQQVLAAKRMVAPNGFGFFHVRGGEVIATSLGPTPKMQAADARALSAAAQAALAFTPQVFPFTVAGPNLILDVQAALTVGATAPLAAGRFNWVGLITTISVATINREPGRIFTLLVNLGPAQGPGGLAQTMSITVRLNNNVDAIEVTHINGLLPGGTPKFQNSDIDLAVAAPLTYLMTIAGLNTTNYSATGRFIQSGDSQAMAMLDILNG